MPQAFEPGADLGIPVILQTQQEQLDRSPYNGQKVVERMRCEGDCTRVKCRKFLQVRKSLLQVGLCPDNRRSYLFLCVFQLTSPIHSSVVWKRALYGNTYASSIFLELYYKCPPSSIDQIAS